MKIGIPKEIKSNEHRVAATPAGVLEMSRSGHTVIVEKTAGLGSGITDDQFVKAGASIADTHEQVFAQTDMIIKVKEPLKEEYGLIRSDHLVFTYFHFAAARELTDGMISSGAACVAYETVTDPDGSLPLLVPMSEVAGRMSVQEGAKYLEKPMMGRGILLGGVPGVERGQVLVLGGGVVGASAARMAAGLGADVALLDISLPRLRHLAEVMPANVQLLHSNHYNIEEQLCLADLLIGAVLIPGAVAPRLVTRKMLSLMKPGAVIVDVAVDQGGCIETIHPTTHADPTYLVDGIVHYGVANMPGAVGRTSTFALTNATLPFVLELAGKGLARAVKTSPALADGLNIIDGKVTHPAVAKAFDMPFVDPVKTVR